MLGTLAFYPLVGFNTLDSSPDEPETIQGQHLKEIFQRTTSLGYLTTGCGSLVPISRSELLSSQFRAEPFALEMDPDVQSCIRYPTSVYVFKLLSCNICLFLALLISAFLFWSCKSLNTSLYFENISILRWMKSLESRPIEKCGG